MVKSGARQGVSDTSSVRWVKVQAVPPVLSGLWEAGSTELGMQRVLRKQKLRHISRVLVVEELSHWPGWQ